MNLGPTTEDGTIYQITDNIAGHDVTVDICYSGNDDNELEFEWARAEADSNPDLTEDQLDEVNDELECGLEERYVIALMEHYENTSIKFNTGEYKFNPLSVLYNKNAETEKHNNTIT